VAQRNRQRNHTAFELTLPSRKRERPELAMEKNHGKDGKHRKEEVKWVTFSEPEA
jgi:hypothetical protein